MGGTRQGRDKQLKNTKSQSEMWCKPNIAIIAAIRSGGDRSKVGKGPLASSPGSDLDVSVEASSKYVLPAPLLGLIQGTTAWIAVAQEMQAVTV